MDKPETSLLLLTASPPGGNGVGDLYLRSLCELLPEPPACVALNAARDGADNNASAEGMLRLGRRYEPAFRPVGGVLGGLSAFAGVSLLLIGVVTGAARLIGSALLHCPLHCLTVK